MLEFAPMANESLQTEKTTPYVDSSLDIDNLPNRLSIFRIILVPLVIGPLLLSHGEFSWALPYKNLLSWMAASLFTLAALTDYFDGHIARKKNIITLFGSFLDPIADKFLVISSLITLQATGKIQVLMVIILVLREFYITALRLLGTNEGVLVSVSSTAKWKTATQMVGLPFLMLPEKTFGLPVNFIGSILIYLSCLLSLYSATHYSLDMAKKIKLIRAEKKKKLES